MEQVMNHMLESPLFGLTLSTGMWCFGVWLQKKTGWVLCNPVLISGTFIMFLLWVGQIPLEHYQRGGEVIKLMLTPVTAVLALQIYRQRAILREYFLPVLAGCLAGSGASLMSVLVLCQLFGLDQALTASLLPKSATTAIAMGISQSQGGVQGITAGAVALAGMTGALLAPWFAKWFRITDPVAEGVAIGACSHALGTTRAMELGQLQGAMSSISLCVSGMFTAILALFL